MARTEASVGGLPSFTPIGDKIGLLSESEQRSAFYKTAGRIVHRTFSRIYYCPTSEIFQGEFWQRYLNSCGESLNDGSARYDDGLAVLQNVFHIHEISLLDYFDKIDEKVREDIVSLVESLAQSPPFPFESTFPDVFLPNSEALAAAKKPWRRFETLDLMVVTGVNG